MNASERVAIATETFLKDCIKRRSLGVAMAQSAVASQGRSFHMVALLQTLPEFMKQLQGPGEAMALSRVVQAVLGGPTEVEAKYIGTAMQSQFGVHLLGYDPPTLQARARELSSTFFLMDSSTLIQFLARSGPANASVRIPMMVIGDSDRIVMDVSEAS